MKSTFRWSVENRLLPWAGISCLGLAMIGCGSGLVRDAQLQPQADNANVRYNITDLGQVGNNLNDPGQPLVISNSGWISGTARVGAAEHAILWHDGQTIDLGAGLAGNSMAYGVNESGTAAGEAETGGGLSTTEDFCGFEAMGFSSSPKPCVPVIWLGGQMISLPTLGGVNGEANQINNSGEVAGYAEGTAQESNCAVHEFEAVVWSHGVAQALPTIAGDNDGVAYAINDEGQAAGTTGDCASFNYTSLIYLNTAHAVLWQNGVATDLGNLGGTANIFNYAHDINNSGEVVGGADAVVMGNETSHAFLWTAATKMQDLGVVGGDFYSVALGINNGGQIVGLSVNQNFTALRAFIRKNGVLVDLNSLVSDNPGGLYLATGCSITSDGSIIGIAIDGNGVTHGYLATPVNGASAGKSSVKPMILPGSVMARWRAAMHM